MKITLEFENAEKFVTELPKFAALMGFAGQFASFDHVEKPSTEPVLNAPELPKVERGVSGVMVTGNNEQLEKVKKLVKSETEKAAETTTDAPEAPKKPKTEKSKGEEEKPAETAPDAPKAAKQITGPEVRAMFNKFIQAGKRDRLREILNGFGAASFSDLKEDRYADFMEVTGKELD